VQLLPHGYASVDTASLVPAELKNISTGDEFLSKLPSFDAHFDKLRADAAKEGMVLRYVGIIDVPEKRVKASLERYVSITIIQAHCGININDNVKIPRYASVCDLSRRI
jgi:hypothetical protein